MYFKCSYYGIITHSKQNLRDKRVGGSLDRDLAEIYRVETQTLSQTVQRNIERFPSDFMFQHRWKETDLKQLIDCLRKDKNIAFEQIRFYPQKQPQSAAGLEYTV